MTPCHYPGSHGIPADFRSSRFPLKIYVSPVEVDQKNDPRADAALRELEEETGLGGRVLKSGGADTVELRERFLEIHLFEIEVEDREVELHHEHRDFQWVSKTEIENFESENIGKDLEAIK